MKETRAQGKEEVLQHQDWEKTVKFSGSRKYFFVILAVLFLLQLPAVAGYEISFTVSPLRTYSYAIDLERNDLLSYRFSVTGGDGSIKFAIMDSGGKIVFDVGKVHYYYSSEFRAPKSDTYSLYFNNRFATIHSKHIRLTYEVRPPPRPRVPPPPAGGSIKVSTDKTTYLVGGEVLITVWYTRPTDLCINHIVKCEIFDDGGRLSGSKEWDDRYVSFPQTWSFQLFQPVTYTIVAGIWHCGTSKGIESSVRITMVRPVVTTTATITTAFPVTIREVTTTTFLSPVATGVDVSVAFVMVVVTALAVGFLVFLALGTKKGS